MRGMSAPGTTIQTPGLHDSWALFRTISLEGFLLLSYKYAGFASLGRLSMELRRVRCFCLCLIVLLGTVQLWADVIGSILGYVRDPSGAVLPNATVTAIQIATGYSRTVVSDASGQY